MAIDLNKASADEIARAVPQIGSERVNDLMDRRPFENWDDVKRVPGFSDGMVEDMQDAGVSLKEGEE